MPATPSPRAICTILQEIWCRSVVLSVSSLNEPKSRVFPPNAIQEDTFSGNKNEDAHDHVDRVLTGAINTWDLLKKAFIQMYYPPSKTAKQLKDIHNFKQETDESLYQAWERYNDLLYKCPTHDINSHQKGPIHGMTPTQPLTAIQTMVDHSQKWHDKTSSRNISNNKNSDGLAAIVSKLDNLGRDMKKLKENIHAIQVGCQICKGPHLNKECPLNEKVNPVEEVKYDEFGCPAPFNRSNEAKFHSRTTNGAPSSSTGQCKVVNADHKTSNIPISSSKLNNLHGVSFLSDSNSQVAQNNEERTTKVLPCKLPPKEQNLGNFTLPCTIGDFHFYAMTDLGASINVMPRGIFEFLKLTNLRKTNMLIEMADMTKKTPLGVVENILVRIDKIPIPF
ncbi:hypothetical protein Tco_0663800 [Tanacetum coccineum]